MRCRTCLCITSSSPCEICHGMPLDAHSLLESASGEALLDRLAVVAWKSPTAVLPRLKSLSDAAMAAEPLLACAYHAARAGDAEVAARFCSRLPEHVVFSPDATLTLVARREGNTVTVEAVADSALGALVAGPEGAVLEAGLPPLPPVGWDELRRQLEREAAAARLMQLALSPRSEPADDVLEAWVREACGTYRAELHQRADALPVPGIEAELRDKAIAKDGKYFATLEVDRVVRTVQDEAAAPVFAAAADVLAEREASLSSELRARFRGRLLTTGLPGLIAAGEELRRAAVAARYEQGRLRDQQERMTTRSREPLEATLETLRRKARGLGWSLGRAVELDELAEQVRLLVERSREAAILKHAEAFADVVDSRGEDQLRALVEPLRAREARVAALDRAAQRSLISVSGDAAGVEALVESLGDAWRERALGWIEGLSASGDGDAAALEDAGRALAEESRLASV